MNVNGKDQLFMKATGDAEWWWCIILWLVHHFAHCTVILWHQFSFTLLPESWPSCRHYFVASFSSDIFSEIWKQPLLLELFLAMESRLFYACWLTMYSILKLITIQLYGSKGFWTGHCPCILCCWDNGSGVVAYYIFDEGFYSVSQKKGATLYMAITLSILDRFAKLSLL